MLGSASLRALPAAPQCKLDWGELCLWCGTCWGRSPRAENLLTLDQRCDVAGRLQWPLDWRACGRTVPIHEAPAIGNAIWLVAAGHRVEASAGMNVGAAQVNNLHAGEMVRCC